MLRDIINSYLDTDILLSNYYYKQRIQKLPIASLSYFPPIHFAPLSIRFLRMLVEGIHILYLRKIQVTQKNGKF